MGISVETYVLFKPTLSTVMACAAFILMIWPGYAVLHLLGFGRHRWAAATYAGPATTLGLMVIVWSGTAWASISLLRIADFIWIATILLGGLGVTLHISACRRATTDNGLPATLWLIAAIIPFAMMPAMFKFGLGIFASSMFPDGWSYMAVADYLSQVPRGAEGGLSPLHQYASHLAYTRNATSSLLAALALGLRVRVDEVTALYCLLVLFANGCALIAFAQTVFKKRGVIAIFLLLSGVAAPALILFFANLDQLLLLPLIPITAAIAIRAGSGQNDAARAGVIAGITLSASVFAYVEMAPLGWLAALSFIIVPNVSFRTAIKRGIIVACVALLVAIALTSPGLLSLYAMLKSQFAQAQMSVRPGEGFVEAVVARFGFLNLRLIDLRAFFAVAIIVVAFLGVWQERERWLSCIAIIAISALTAYFIYPEKYLYGAYKILSITLWMTVFFIIIGTTKLLRLVAPLIQPKGLAKLSAGGIALACIATMIFAHGVFVRTADNGLQQQRFREAAAMADIVGNQPTLLSVRDDLANQWAVLHFARATIMLSPLRIYMAQPHVVPLMNRAYIVDPSSIRFILTDRGPSRVAIENATIISESDIYTLWRVNHPSWTVSAEGGPHNDRIFVRGSPD